MSRPGADCRRLRNPEQIRESQRLSRLLSRFEIFPETLKSQCIREAFSSGDGFPGDKRGKNHEFASNIFVAVAAVERRWNRHHDGLFV